MAAVQVLRNGVSIHDGMVQIGNVYISKAGHRLKVTDIQVATKCTALQTHSTIYVTYDWQKTVDSKNFGYDEKVNIHHFLTNINEF
jgi:hypothetical protein